MERRCKLATISSHSSTRTCITRCVDHSGDSSAGLRDADMTHHCERVHLACELLTNRKIFRQRHARTLSVQRRSSVAPSYLRADALHRRGMRDVADLGTAQCIKCALTRTNKRCRDSARLLSFSHSGGKRGRSGSVAASNSSQSFFHVQIQARCSTTPVF